MDIMDLLTWIGWSVLLLAIFIYYLIKGLKHWIDFLKYNHHGIAITIGTIISLFGFAMIIYYLAISQSLHEAFSRMSTGLLVMVLGFLGTRWFIFRKS